MEPVSDRPANGRSTKRTPRHVGARQATTNDPRDAKRQLAEQIVAMRNQPLLVWSEPHATIDYPCVHRLRETLNQWQPVSRMDLLIASPGGYIDDAYQCLRLLRRFSDHITLLIPQAAKSAATFLALGADQLLFGLEGNLGPLDAQLDDPRGFSKPVSALNEFKSLEYIREYSMETLDLIVMLMVRRSLMDVPYALEHARSTIGAFTTPLYSQVRPQDLGEYRRSLAIGEEYAKRALRRWGYKDLDENAISEIVTKLVWDYPAHDFVIDCDEAQAIGLHAQEMSPDLDELCIAIVRDHIHYFEGVGFQAVTGKTT